MPQIQISSREFNQDLARAKRAAEGGPVVITDRGRPTHVLMRYEEYRRLSGSGPTILALLEQPGLEDLELQIPRLEDGPARLGDHG